MRQSVGSVYSLAWHNPQAASLYTWCQLLTMVSAYTALMYQALVDVYRVSIFMRRCDTSYRLQLSVT